MESRYLFVASDHEAQRARDHLRIHSEVGGAFTIDDDLQLRLVQLQRNRRVRNPEFFRTRAEVFSVIEQLLKVGPFQRKRNVDVAATKVDGLEIGDLRANITVLSQLLADDVHDVALMEVAGECFARIRVKHAVDESR